MKNHISKWLIFAVLFLGVNPSSAVCATGSAVCKSSFPSALGATSNDTRGLFGLDKDGLFAFGVSIIHNNGQDLVTKRLGGLALPLCNGSFGCHKTGTLAPKYNFDLDTGDGSDGAAATVLTLGEITESKNFTSVTSAGLAAVKITGDVTIKSQNSFIVGGATILQIDGHVTIEADKFKSIGGSRSLSGSSS